MSANSKQDAYELVTKAIIEGLKQGRVPWRRPWSVLRPFNPESGTVYKGINTILLSMTLYSDPRWMTFKQISELGGKVRKGQKGTVVVLWKWNQYTDDNTGEVKSYPLLKHFYVWNVEQTEGLDLPPLEQVKDNEPIEACEELVRLMPNAPEIRHGGRLACYAPRTDVVTMPAMELFETPQAYYGTLFHELGHATGHTSRLNRPEMMGTDGFGNESYSREELVAELCAAFLCQATGIDNDTQNTQAYINGWLHQLQNDPKMIVWAAGRAAKAADYIQGKQGKQEAEEAEEPRKLVTA